MNKKIIILLLLLFTITICGCKKESTNPSSKTKSFDIVDVSFENEELYVGDKTKIVCANYDLSFFNLTYDKEIIEIDAHGNISALKEGNASITFTHKTNPENTKTLTLSIKEKLIPITYFVEENLSALGLYDFLINDSSDFSDFIVTTNSSDLIVQDGYLHALKEGNYTIQISEKANLKNKKEVNIEIKQANVQTPKTEFNVTNNIVEVGNKISLRYTNGYRHDDFDYFLSFDEKYDVSPVSFDNAHRIVGDAPCSGVVYVRLKDDHHTCLKLDFEITSVLPILHIYKDSLYVGEKSYIAISNLSDTKELSLDNFTFTSSDESILKVDGTTMLALKEGSVNICAKSKFNENVFKISKVNVVNKEESAVIDLKSEYLGNLKSGEQVQIQIYDDEIKDLSLYTFVSSDEEKIRITENGLITVLKNGFVSLIAYEKTDPAKKYTLKFNIDGVAQIDYVERLLNLALGEVGYVERYDAELKEYVNDTKYNHWYNMDGAWCAMFVSWNWYHAGLSNDLLVKYCSCSAGKAWCEQKGIFKYKENYKPKSGDIIFFLSAGASHTGIVVYSDDSYVYTVEGNASNRVDVWRWSINDARITGYASPDYPEFSGTPADFSWIKEMREDGTYLWNNVKEKQNML